MTGLPIGWDAATLGELVTLKTGPFGSALHKSDYVENGIPIINPMHIRNGKLVPSAQATVSAATAKRLAEYQLMTGDVVLGRRGQMGRCAVVEERQVGWLCGTGCLIVRPTDAIRASYLQRFLSSPETIRILEDESVGSTMVNLNQGILNGVIVPVPPFAEQEHISNKLHQLIASVNSCESRLERIPRVLERFREAVLEAAVSGRLTEEWRSSRNRDLSEWSTTTFDANSEYITVGHVGKMSSEYLQTGVPFLRSLNVRPFKFDRKDLKFVSRAFHTSLPKSSLRPGDVVVVRSGAPGQCCVIPGDLPEANCSDLVILRPLKSLDPQYACIFINARQSQNFVRSEQVGVAQAHFNVGSMKITPLHLPPLDEQHEIVRRVVELRSLAEEIEKQYETAVSKVDNLTPSLLAKAFRGELVPQDLKDEPASVLLARIRKGRAEAGTEKVKSADGQKNKRASFRPVKADSMRLGGRKVQTVAARSGSVSRRAGARKRAG